MKKYLYVGLLILVGTNLVALSGVVYNRMGDATAHLTLTGRELVLPYSSSSQKENSGTLLKLNWRTPSGANQNNYPYSSRNITITKDELIALGFEKFDAENSYFAESQELYWALEFDGALHEAEIERAIVEYKAATADFNKNRNDATRSNKRDYRERLEKERVVNSRLFIVKASANYESLAGMFSGRQNIVIIKGLSRPYYNRNDKTYSLMLRESSVSNIMVPLQHTKLLSKLTRFKRKGTYPPRFAVEIKWGNRLEPWIVDVKKLLN